MFQVRVQEGSLEGYEVTFLMSVTSQSSNSGGRSPTAETKDVFPTGLQRVSLALIHAEQSQNSLSPLYDFFQLPARVFVVFFLVLDFTVFVGTDCSTVPDLLVLSSL